MSILWTYGAGVATILLALFSLIEDFFINKNSKRRIGMSVGLLIATAVTMISIRGADKQHTEDEEKITNLQRQVSDLGKLVQQANLSEKENTTSLSNARAADTKQFLAEFDKLSNRVANLQSQVATTDLKAEAERLQADLESTRKSMIPPKATLTYTFQPNSREPTHTLVTQQADNAVHIKFTVDDPTDTDAQDGSVIVLICDLCKFKGEPSGAEHIKGSPETQRNFPFTQILAHTKTPPFEFDIESPTYPFQIAVLIVCHTCVPMNTDLRYNTDALATVYATNPQAFPHSHYPPITVRPFIIGPAGRPAHP